MPHQADSQTNDRQGPKNPEVIISEEPENDDAIAPQADVLDREPSTTPADRTSHEVEPVSSQHTKQQKIPLMLRRLLPHNSAGRLEQ